MKKILSMVLALALALSFTLTSFAETYIHKTYMDTETGIIYHYGSFDEGDTDAGVMINGKKYSLKNGIYMGDGANAFAKSSTREDSLKNKFMIGFKAHDSVSDTYQVTPYAENAEGIVTSHSVTVYKNAYPAPLLTKTVNAITDDIYMNSSGIGNVNGTYGTIKTDGLYGGLWDNKAQLYITMMKIDLSKFSDAAEGSNFILNVSGYVGEPSGVCNIDKINVKAYGIPAEAFAEAEGYWTESDYSSLGGHADWYASYIEGKPALDVIKLSTADSQNIYRKLNITGYIQNELAKKSSYATIALIADNKEAEANAVEDNKETTDVDESVRNVMRFYCYTKDSTTPPYVEYQYGDKAVELNQIKIGDSFINLDMLDSENTYYKYLTHGTTELPVVTATATENATVSVTQADWETKEATITLQHSYYTDVTKTYKVKFVETDRNYSLKGKITKGYIAKVNATDNSVNNAVNQINARDIYGTRAGYEPRMGIMQFDFSALENAEPKSTYILEIGNMSLNVASDNPSAKVKAEVSLYDMTEDIIWEDITDESGNIITANNVSDGTLSKNVEGNVEGKTPIASFTSDDWGGTTDGGDYMYLDISDFVKSCIENGNLTPSIGFRVKALIPEGYTNAPGYAYTRTNFTIANNNADYLNIRCIDYIAPDLTCELTGLNIGEESVGLQWFDSENTYYKYLPYGTTELPEVSATVNNAATFEITQATMDSKEATITVTNINDTSVTKTYKVKFVISETESADAKYDFYGNILNDYAFKQNSATDEVNTGLKVGDNYSYIYAGDVAGTIQNYKPYMGIIQLDLSILKDADLSGDFIMNMRYFANTVGEEADRTDENLKAEISLYDMTGDINWATDTADGIKSKDIEGNTAGKTPFASFEYGNVAYGTDIYKELDISEFIRKCIRENNLTPSIGFRVEMPKTNEYNYANAYARTAFILYCNGSNRLVINYKK